MTGRRHNAHFRRMLIGYDGSPQSEKAVEIAFSLAQCIDSTVLVLAVARPPEPATSVELVGSDHDQIHLILSCFANDFFGGMAPCNLSLDLDSHSSHTAAKACESSFQLLACSSQAWARLGASGSGGRATESTSSWLSVH
jgi:nucleotide-binding universal stress UspA family protein